MPAKCSLLALIALLGLLALDVSGALPPGPFANKGGPSFINGATFLLGEDGEIAAVALVSSDGYVAAMAVNGTLLAERGVYTSWECDKERPGYYLALVDITVTDPAGAVVDERTVCELGTSTDTENRWAQSAVACPTETDRANRFLEPKLAPVNECAP